MISPIGLVWQKILIKPMKDLSISLTMIEVASSYGRPDKIVWYEKPFGKLQGNGGQDKVG